MTARHRLQPAALIARLTVQEALRQRGALVVAVVSGVLLALFAVAAREALHLVGQGSVRGVDRYAIGATLLGTAAFCDLLLGAFVAVFLAHSSFRGDADRGLLQPLLVRPVSRRAVLAGRLAASAALAAVYTLALWFAAVGLLRVAGGWAAPHWVAPGLVLAGAVALIALLAVSLSTFLAAMGTGIVTLVLVAVGLTVGLLAQFGERLGLPVLERVANGFSLALPFEALYRDVLAIIGQDVGDLGAVGLAVGPFGGAHAASPAVAAAIAAWVAVLAAAALWSVDRLEA
jgi:Cu-processing system permease protein